MINLKANSKLKAMGCKWDKTEWVAPELAKDKAQEIKDFFYKDWVSVEVEVKDVLAYSSWGYSHARTVGGYIVATASGRDSGAKIADEVAVICGSFKSGGSVKNYRCIHSDDLIIRLNVSRKSLSILDEEVNEGRYVYRVLEETNYKTMDQLQAEKKDLLLKIEEIELQINKLEATA